MIASIEVLVRGLVPTFSSSSWLPYGSIYGDGHIQGKRDFRCIDRACAVSPGQRDLFPHGSRNPSDAAGSRDCYSRMLTSIHNHSHHQMEDPKILRKMDCQ